MCLGIFRIDCIDRQTASRYIETPAFRVRLHRLYVRCIAVCCLCVCVECAFIERFLWFLVHFLFHVSKPWFSRSHPNYWYRRLVCNLSVRMCLCVWDFCMFDFCFNQAFVCFNRVPFLVCKLLFDGQRISFRCFIKFFFGIFFSSFTLFYCCCIFRSLVVVAIAASLPWWWCFSSLIHTCSHWGSLSLSLFGSCFFVCMKNSYVNCGRCCCLLRCCCCCILLYIFFSCFSKCTWAYFVSTNKKPSIWLKGRRPNTNTNGKRTRRRNHSMFGMFISIRKMFLEMNL